MKNQIFSKTAQPILMTKIYVIEGTREVLKKNVRTHFVHGKRMRKIVEILK